MLISIFYLDDDVQSLETHRKTITVSLHQGAIFCLVMIILGIFRVPEQKITVSLQQVPIFYWVVTMHSPLKLPENIEINIYK